MDQLYLSFKEEILLNLKKTDWEFKTKPDSLTTFNKKEKFIELDRSNQDVKDSASPKENILKIVY